MSSTRRSSQIAQLARLSFADPDRAARLLADPALAGLIDPLDDVYDDGILQALGDAADPDRALLSLVRMLGELRENPTSHSDAQPARIIAQLRSGGPGRDRLIAVLGGSVALGEHLIRHPEHWTVLTEGDPADRHRAEVLRADLLRAVGADPSLERPVAGRPRDAATDALRVAYRRRLLAIAGRDLVADDPLSLMPTIAAELADLASAALEAALSIARSELPENATPCRFAVIGMGKAGGGELNYVSDVDVIYVAEPLEPGADGPAGDEAGALKTATKLAVALSRACSASTAEGTLWPVDAALRPEGKSGLLVRTVASHVAYYERWAQTWEFQALLKARAVAGDRRLGQLYLDAIVPMVWRAAERENFVEDVQAMRRRVEEHISVKDADRQLKLGAGGLRDVEFSVQLLQLVHGRIDPRLRTPNTLAGLEALSTHGYVGRDDAADLDRAYRFLRTLEHRIQLYRLHRTHVLPDSPADLRWLGRSLGMLREPAASLQAMRETHARQVRRLHEKLFYRPLLAAAARLSTDEVRLTPEAAQARLAALGYRDPAGAMRHLTALTSGVSRRAAIQRQLLPVMLGWFAGGANPDGGLLAFRRVSDELGTTHWYLKMLRDSGAGAERMARMLAASQFLAAQLERAPEAVQMLGDDDALQPVPRTGSVGEVRRVIDRHLDAGLSALEPGQADAALRDAVLAARGIRRRELVRTAIGDLAGLLDLDQVGAALTDAAVAALDGALRAASAPVAAGHGGTLPTRLLVVGMGRLGGGELGYGSDADVLFVHDPLPGVDERVAQDAAMAVFSDLRRLLAVPGPDPTLEVDADLRPEGRNGPLVRTLDSYAAYYRRWSLTWEAQALTRAAPMAGDEDLAARFVELIDPIRWPVGGLDETGVREVRRIKARVEAERLPRGADPTRHLKLGRGGISDVEWTVQLMQLRHGWRIESLRTPSTMTALTAAVEADLIDVADGEVLAEAWRLASRVRNANVLWRGRGSDLVPTKRLDLDGVARIIGYRPGATEQLDEDYRRITRRARAVFERVFYG